MSNSINTQFKCKNSQLSKRWFSFISSIDRTLSGASTLSQSGLGSNGKQGVLCIPQSSKTGASLSDCFVSYPRHSLSGCSSWQRRSQWILQPCTCRLGCEDKSLISFIINLNQRKSNCNEL